VNTGGPPGRHRLELAKTPASEDQDAALDVLEELIEGFVSRPMAHSSWRRGWAPTEPYAVGRCRLPG
jgi:hypothetical protein